MGICITSGYHLLNFLTSWPCTVLGGYLFLTISTGGIISPKADKEPKLKKRSETFPWILELTDGRDEI